MKSDRIIDTGTMGFQEPIELEVYLDFLVGRFRSIVVVVVDLDFTTNIYV